MRFHVPILGENAKPLSEEGRLVRLLKQLAVCLLVCMMKPFHQSLLINLYPPLPAQLTRVSSGVSAG